MGITGGYLSISDRIKNLEWQEKFAIAFVILLVLIELYFFSGLKHLPGPMYGGDLYAHHGFTINYLENGFTSDPYFVGEYAFYPWLGNMMIAIFSFLTGSSLMAGMIYFPILSTVLSALAYWLLGKQVFKSKTYALLTMLAYLVIQGIPGPAPNALAWMITIPFFFYFWLRTEENPNLKNRILAGVFLGLTSLIQVAFFLAALSVFIGTIVIETVLKWKKEGMKIPFKKYAPILFIGFLVSLPFYGVILFNYAEGTKNPLFQYNGPDVDALGVGWVVKNVFRTFIDTTNVFRFFFGLAALIGAYIAFKNFKKQTPRFILLWYIIGFLTPLHHLLTRPLFDKWVLPGHLWGTSASVILFSVYGLMFIFATLDKKFEVQKADYAKILIVAAILLPLLYFKVGEFNNDRWVNYGRQVDGLTAAWLDAGDWIQSNTDINTVFLGYDESCFAMNGVSGRKCVAVRRTHANYFVDVEQRYADAVVMLYGKDSKTVGSLLKQYDVQYLVVDPYLMQGYWKIDLRFETYLKQNGIQYQKGRDRLDPSEADAKQFDLLLVPAQEITMQDRLQAAAAFPNDKPQVMIFKII